MDDAADVINATSSNTSQLRKRPRGLSGEDSSNDDLFATVQYALDFPLDNPQEMDARRQGLPHIIHREHDEESRRSSQGLGQPEHVTAASIHGLGGFDHLAFPASSSNSGTATATPVAVGFNTGSTKVASAIASLITDRAQNGHGHGLVLGRSNSAN